MGEDGRAFDRGAALEMGARKPGVGFGIVGRGVAGAEVEE